MVLLLKFIFIKYFSFFNFFDSLWMSTFFLTIWFLSMHYLQLETLNRITAIIALVILNCIRIYIKTKNSINNYNNLKKNEVKRKNQEILVSHLLPIHVNIRKFFHSIDF